MLIPFETRYGLLVSACHLGRGKPHLRNCFLETGLWPSLLSIFLIKITVAGPSSLGGSTTRQVVWGCKENQARVVVVCVSGVICVGSREGGDRTWGNGKHRVGTLTREGRKEGK